MARDPHSGLNTADERRFNAALPKFGTNFGLVIFIINISPLSLYRSGLRLISKDTGAKIQRVTSTGIVSCAVGGWVVLYITARTQKAGPLISLLFFVAQKCEEVHEKWWGWPEDAH